jgi:hypothetical protein
LRRGLLSIAAAMVILAVAGVWHGGYADGPPAPTATAPTSPTPTASASLITKMVGANETSPNKSPATGTAKITVDMLHDQVCWNLSVQKLQGTVTQAHIHRAPAGKDGPVVLGLSPPTGGSSRGCKRAGPSLARDIVKDPGAYYVNVHTSKFPEGEIRGQL